MTVKYFITPFALDGTRTAIPNPPDMTGLVSYDQGFTADYALPIGDPDRKSVPRDKFNGLIYDITLAIQQYQQHGTPDFITSSDNGGSPFPYAKDARVIYSGVVYTSLVGSNTDTPPSANWQTAPTVPASVSSVSVATANGFAGTVATATTTPAITISTTVTGLLKGNGTAVSAAVAGTDYVTPGGNNGAVAAWVNFNGVGSAVIRGSLNISSVDYNAAGDYTVHFSITFANTNYAYAGNSAPFTAFVYQTSPVLSLPDNAGYIDKATTYARVRSESSNGGYNDAFDVNLLFAGSV